MNNPVNTTMDEKEKQRQTVLLKKLDELPTLPTIVYEIGKVINNPMSSIQDVEDIMSKDQSLTAKVLRLANSAYYAIPGGAKTLSRAVVYLGFDTLNQLVLSASLISTLQFKQSKDFDISAFWKHSLGVATAAEVIGRLIHHRAPSELFAAGLLHDIGKVALFVIDPEGLNRTSRHAREHNMTFVRAEQATGVLRHTEVGAVLAQKWNLPLSIQNAIRHHHQPDYLRRSGISVEMHQVVDAIVLANAVVLSIPFGNSGHESLDPAPESVTDRLGLDSSKVAELQEETRVKLALAGDFLKAIDEGKAA